MIRSVAVIAIAIGLSAPWTSKRTRHAHARVAQQTARVHGIDPLTLVAVAHSESGWRPGLVGGGNGCTAVGLGQVCLENFRECQQDRDGAACEARRSSLLDPAVNLRTMASMAQHWQRWCRHKTGNVPTLPRWLAAYGGYNDPARGIWCNQRRVRGRWRDMPTVPRATAKAIRHRAWLIRRLGVRG